MNPLDQNTIGQLQELLGDEFLSVYEAFIGSTTQYLTELEQAIARHDVEQIKVISHTLKGSGANIGALRLSRISENMMNKLKSDPQCDVSDCLAEIKAEYQKVHAAIKALFAGNDNHT